MNNQLVIRNAAGVVINIGPWDYANPLPAGAYESTADIIKSADGGLFAAENHRGLRVGEYPPIGDQLDALFKAGVFPPEMAARLQAVKDKFPKTV